MEENQNLRRMKLKKIASITGALFFGAAAISGAILIAEQTGLTDNHVIYQVHVFDETTLHATLDSFIKGETAAILPTANICPLKTDTATPKEEKGLISEYDDNKKILDILSETDSEVIYYSMGCTGGAGAILY